MVPVRAVHMTVFQFFAGRRTYAINCATESQRHAGERMIAVYDYLVVGDVGDGIDPALVGLTGLPFKTHADFDRRRELVACLHLHEFFVIVAKRVDRLQVHVTGVARLLALERLFHLGEYSVITAVQVFDRLFGLLYQLAFRIQQLILNRYYGVLPYFHLPALRKKPSTSAACPRGLTPYEARLMMPSLSMTKVER